MHNQTNNLYICKTNQVNVNCKVKKILACRLVVVVISSMWVIFYCNLETTLNHLFLLRERKRGTFWKIFFFFWPYLMRIIVFQLWSNSYLFICLSIIYWKLVVENQHMTCLVIWLFHKQMVTMKAISNLNTRTELCAVSFGITWRIDPWVCSV